MSESPSAAPSESRRHIYPIVKRGESDILTIKAARVEKFNSYLSDLVEDMFATMYEAEGIGLAAPQIGVSLRVAVIDISCGEIPEAKIVLINPNIVGLGGIQIGDEGCLSMPGLRCEKQRFKEARVQAKTAKGKSFTLSGTGLLARAIQHELDHLNGVLLEVKQW